MTEEAEKKQPRLDAEMILKLTKEAKRVERAVGAESCIVIAIFREGNELKIQDAGRFPLDPDHFYDVMQKAHRKNMLGSPKKILRN